MTDADVDTERVQWYLREMSYRKKKAALPLTTTPQELMTHLGLLNDGVYTWAAALCFARNPQRWCYRATLRKKSVARAKTTNRSTTQQTKLKTTQQTTQQVDLLEVVKSVLSGNSLRLALLVLQRPSVKIEEMATELELSRDGVNYHIRRLKQMVGLQREGAFQSSVWKFALPKRLLRRGVK